MTSYVTQGSVPGVCQNTWNFWYDVDYPVMFTLRYTGSGGPFTYRFAVPVEVQRNVLAGTEETFSATKDFCRDITLRKITLTPVEENTGNPIANVDAMIECAGRHHCMLETNDMHEINDYLPNRCMTGAIVLRKEGYETKRVSYDMFRFNDLDGSEIPMQPLRTVELEFVNCEGDCDPGAYVFIAIRGSDVRAFDRDGYVQLSLEDDWQIGTYRMEDGIPNRVFDPHYTIESLDRTLTIEVRMDRIDDPMYAQNPAEIFTEVST